MSRLDQLTSGERERHLMAKLRRGAVPADRLAEHLLPFFVKVQLQTTTYCNASCTTCPYPQTAATQSMGRMTESLFSAIVRQMEGRGVERVSLFLMNEPLLDRRLEAFVTEVKARLPTAAVTIITNGTLLDGERARALAVAGMDEISVSVNGFEAASHAATMVGLDFDRIAANLRDVAAARARGELGTLDVRVVALDLGDAAARAPAFAASIGLPVYLKPVTNRAGSVDTSPWRDDGALPQRRSICQRPFVKAYVLYNGDMVLCNCDWDRRVVIGNVTETPLHELWRDRALDQIRAHHLRGDLPAGSLCAGCDYPALLDS